MRIMRCRNTVTLITSFLIFCALVGMFSVEKTKMLFSDIESEDVLSISAIFGTYPEYALYENDQEKLLSYLQQVEVGEIVSDDVEYVGVIEKMFVLHMVDGTNISISASNPLFIVDGTRYKSTSGMCKDISDMYDSYINRIRAESKPIS